MAAKKTLLKQLVDEKNVWLEQLAFIDDKAEFLKCKQYIFELQDKIERLSIELEAVPA